MGLFAKATGPRLEMGKIRTDSFTVGEHTTFLVVGLGNPGKEHEKNRHNVGFMMLNKLAEKYGVSWTSDNKKKVDICQYDTGLIKLTLVKPTTFMNLSGDAVQAIKNYYKVKPENVIVISDDIDLDFGKIRVRLGGGSGGHNGLADVTEKIGDQYWRIRIGCKNELRNKVEASDFVLSNFTKEEERSLQSLAFLEVFQMIQSACQGRIKDDTVIFQLAIT